MFGYLYLAEKKAKDDLNTLLGLLKGDWAKKIAQLANPAATGKELKEKSAVYTTFVEDIKRAKDKVPVMHLRAYIADLKRIVEIAQDIPEIPKPVAPPKPEPKPEPKPAPKKIPPAPPGMRCPHYTKASAYPANWNDPAASKRYLDKYPDVKKAIVLKRQPSALWHYRCYGKRENRTWAGLGQVTLNKGKMMKLYAVVGGLALLGLFTTLGGGSR